MIAGVCAGVLIIIGALMLWYFLRKRKRRETQWQSKAILMSPQDTPKPSHFMEERRGEESEKENWSSNKSASPIHPPSSRYHTGNHFTPGAIHASDCPSTSSLPVPLQLIPSPTPRDRRTGNINYGSPNDSPRFIASENQKKSSRSPSSNGKHHHSLSVSTVSLPNQSYNNSKEQRDIYTNTTSHLVPNDFYVDMLNFVANASDLKQQPTSPCTPLPNNRPVSIVSQTPARPRSPSAVSMKNGTGGETGGATPRASRESRRNVYNFPPPPPPPSVPPPAIPSTIVDGADSTRSSRPRASTVTSVGAQSFKGMNRQRSQSNAQLTDEFTEALGHLYPALPLPVSLASKHGDMDLDSKINQAPTRPVLRQHHSYHESICKNP
ncbi:hypothetical protein BGZ76_001474 [Entomortierella beljakovae]|nr:hypothetical protein BGZ76_001474 [Entomortierella beljakovae]